MKPQTPFHVVTRSPWPLAVAASAFLIITTLIEWIHSYDELPILALLVVPMFLGSLLIWLRDIVREGSFEGAYTVKVRAGLKLGFLLFLVTEAMLFLSYFWAFFHFRLSPSAEVGATWPTAGVEAINPYGAVMYNTVLLITSGIVTEWMRREVMAGDIDQAVRLLMVIIADAMTFTYVQICEYFAAPFDIQTEFLDQHFSANWIACVTRDIWHDLSVCCSLEDEKLSLSREHHLGLVFAAWYWHFVDVVWVGVYLFVYLIT